MVKAVTTTPIIRPEIEQAIRESVYGRIVAGDYTNGIISFFNDDCEVRSGGEVVYFNNDLARCKRWAEQAGFYFEYSKPAQSVTDTVKAQVAKTKTAPRPRCPHYKQIQTVFAIAKDKRLNTKADEAMRAAFARALGREIESREEMSGSDWFVVGHAMKNQGLVW